MIRLGYVQLIIAIALIMFVGCGSDNKKEQNDSKTTPTTQVASATLETELTAAMDEAIKFVESGDIRGLFERFTPPEDLQRLKDSNQLDAAIAQFNIFKGAFVEAMNESKTIKPEFSEDSTRASYHVIETPVPGEHVVFRKIDGKWYFSD